MRVILLSIAFLFLAFSAQSQILKSAGVWYFLDVDSMAARPAVLPNGTEIAYVVGTRDIYCWNRTSSAWEICVPAVDSTVFATLHAVGDSIAAALGYVAANYFPLQGGTLTGTGGNGFVGFPVQSSTPATPSTGFSLYAGSTGNNISWMQPDGFFRRLVSPVTGTPRQYQFMARSYTLGDSADIANNVTSIAANYIATSNGSNLVARNLFDNNTYVGVLNSKPWQFGQWTTAGRPSGVNLQVGANTTTNFIEGYFTSQWENFITSIGASSGQVGYFTSAGKITGSNNLFWDNTNIRLGIGNAAPSYLLDAFKASANENVIFRIGTSSNGNLATARFRAQASSNNNDFVEFLKFSSGISYKIIAASDGAIYNGTTGNIAILNESATGTIKFGAGGTSTAHMTVAANGNLLLGTTTDVTGYKLNISSTGAISIPRGTVAQRPTIASSTTPFRYNTDSTALEYGESVGIWRQIATRAYARSLVSALPTTNIYTANGTLTGHRTVTSGGFDLTMTGKVKIGSDSSFIHDPSVDTTYIKGTLNTPYMYSGSAGLYSRTGGVVSLKTTYADNQASYFQASSKSRYGWLGGLYLSNNQGTGYNFETGYEIYKYSAKEAYVGRNYILEPKTGFVESHFETSLDTAIVPGSSWAFIRIGTKTNNSVRKSLWFTSLGDNSIDTTHFRFNNANGAGVATGKFFSVEDNGANLFVVRKNGTTSLNTYGTGTKEAADLGKTQSNYITSFATDGTVLDLERKRDTTIYVTDADYNFSAAITSTNILKRYNRILIYSKLTSGATSDNQIFLHSASSDFLQCEIIIYSNDASADSDATSIDFTTNGAVDGAGGTVSSYGMSAGQRVNIRAVDDGGYKWFFN